MPDCARSTRIRCCCLLALEQSTAVVPIIGNPPSSRHRSPALSKGVMVEYHFGKSLARSLRPGAPGASLIRGADGTALGQLQMREPKLAGRPGESPCCVASDHCLRWHVLRRRINTGDCACAKTLRGTLLASPDCVACYVACLLLLCCFLGCLLRWLLCYCFLGCHCFYSPFVESTSNLQEILCS